MWRNPRAVSDGCQGWHAVVPEGEAVLITDNPKLLKISKLFANNITVVKRSITEPPLEILWQVVEQNKDKLFSNNKQIAAVYVSNYVITARANSITILDHTDFGL